MSSKKALEQENNIYNLRIRYEKAFFEQEITLRDKIFLFPLEQHHTVCYWKNQRYRKHHFSHTTELELELMRLRTLKWRKTKHLQVLSVSRMSTWLTHWRNLNMQEAAVDTNLGGFSFQFHLSHHKIADFQDRAFQRTTPEKKLRKSAEFCEAAFYLFYLRY